jgi:hypothetical protein
MKSVFGLFSTGEIIYELNRCIYLNYKAFSALHLKGHKDFSSGQRTSLLVPFAPPP